MKRAIHSRIAWMLPVFIVGLLAWAAAGWSQTGQQSIVNSPHNLSAGGPGAIRATTEQEICVFCHTPHQATTVQPLWNRNLPVSAYKPYTSNSLKALPGQPTGSSKLCLSCHDGTIALGAVVSRSQTIQMAGGMTTLPPGAKSNLGTDLSDDHPISFRYDTALVSKNPKLKDPSVLPTRVRLDANKELQCLTCHDAHNNQYGKFLVMSNANSELCNSCHASGVTEVAAHTPCANCHQSHTAPSGPYLLVKSKVSETCLTCHSGAGGANQGPNIAGAMVANPHDTASAVNLSNHIPNNVDCKDCHEQHTMKLASGAAAPGVQGTLGKIDGISITGSTVANAQYEYEVCLKCHADKSAINPRISRKIVQNNIRLKIEPSAVSFHPIAAKGKNSDVPSLRPGWTVSSQIYCTDCHGSDTSKKAGGTGPDGPHGSSQQAILLKRYDRGSSAAYSTTAYALCFNCHDSTKIVADTGPFKYHKRHIQEEQTPCSVCHDPHGVASGQGTALNNFALINFDTSVVLPDDTTHTISYSHTGSRTGSCTLKCHGVNHTNRTY